MINLFPTSKSPIKEFVDQIFSLEKNDQKIISISFIHGFIWGDVADLGAKILVYTDQSKDPDGQHAKKIATELGEMLYQLREKTKLNLPGVYELKNILNKTIKGPAVIGDFSDNPGLGGMGDATFILKEILNSKITNAVFATIFDPTVVEEAFAAGINQTISVSLGGNFGLLSGEKIHKKAKVKFLNPELTQTFSGMSLPLGKAALLEIEGNSIIVNSLRSQIYSPDSITNMNVTIADKKAIIVKSSEHFRAAFSPIAGEIIQISSPGVGNINISEIPYKKASQSLWPLAKN